MAAAGPPEAESPAEEAEPGPDRAVLEHAENAGGPARSICSDTEVRHGLEQDVELLTAAAVERRCGGYTVGHAREEADEAGDEQVQLRRSVKRRAR